MTSTAKPVITSYKQFYTSPWGIAFIAYFVAMGLVGAFTPADILKANLWAREFCDFMANIVPQIDAVTKLNIAPDINRFYFSVMWAGSPVLGLFFLISTWKTSRLALAYKNGLFRASFLKGCGLFLMAYLLFWAVPLDLYWLLKSKTPSLLERSTFGYALGRTGIPQSFVAAPVMFAVYTSIWLYGWLTGYIPRNIKYQNELEQNNG